MKRRFAVILSLVGSTILGCQKADPGTTITAPGVSVQVGPNGSTVTAPGVNVQSGPDGANVSAPGVNIQAR